MIRCKSHFGLDTFFFFRLVFCRCWTSCTCVWLFCRGDNSYCDLCFGAQCLVSQLTCLTAAAVSSCLFVSSYLWSMGFIPLTSGGKIVSPWSMWRKVCVCVCARAHVSCESESCRYGYLCECKLVSVSVSVSAALKWKFNSPCRHPPVQVCCWLLLQTWTLRVCMCRCESV